ncbi:CsbD family protein [Skermania sp. ID1734]|nr:CsbD family protein [Skermania sp. ID1734]
MSGMDKARNKFDELTGKAKQKYGEATGNASVEARGRRRRVGGNLRQAGQKIKDAFKR